MEDHRAKPRPGAGPVPLLLCLAGWLGAGDASTVRIAYSPPDRSVTAMTEAISVVTIRKKFRRVEQSVRDSRRVVQSPPPA